MGQRQIQVGFIGVGAFAARQHLPNLLRDDRFAIHTLCDVNAELLARRAEAFKPVRVTTDADALLGDPEIDVVFVGTRSREHAPLILRAAARRKHVYVEKPMTMTMDETAAVLDAATGAGIRVGVGFNRRFAPSMIRARALLRSFRHSPANVIYRIVDDHAIRPGYIFDMNDGGGHLLQEACHVFDLLAWMLDEEPIEVYAAGPIETDNVVVLKFSGGSLATVLCGGKGGQFYPKECMELFCDRTTLVVDHFYELRMDGPTGNTIERFALDANNTSVLTGKSMTALYEASFAQRPDHDVTDTTEANALATLKVDKGHTAAIAAFSDALVAGADYQPNVFDGARATVMALRAYESIRCGQPIAIDTRDYLR